MFRSFPSSHCSVPSIILFPQTLFLTQVEADPLKLFCEHVQLSSTSQNTLHPSFGLLLLSSQPSPVSTMPFPQPIVLITQLDFPTASRMQLHPFSTSQSPLQPSPLKWLPSSHCSPNCVSRIEFPHFNVQLDVGNLP